MNEAEVPASAPDDEPDFGLTADDGNVRVAHLLAIVEEQVRRGEVGRREAVVLMSDGVRAIADDHPEVTDATVRTTITAAIGELFADQGWERLEPFEF